MKWGLQMVITRVDGISANLKSQLVISGWGGIRRAARYAFTEQGAAMLSSGLRSVRAIHVNIEIMRAFVRLRQMITAHAQLARKLKALERKYDAQFSDFNFIHLSVAAHACGFVWHYRTIVW